MVKKNNTKGKNIRKNTNNKFFGKGHNGKSKNNQFNQNNNKNNNNNNQEDIHVDNTNFFDFDGDTNILNKLNGQVRSKAAANKGWSYNNVIKEESHIRKIKQAEKNEKNEMSDNEMDIDDNENDKEREISKSNEVEDFNSNNVNKFESEVYSKDASFCDFNLSKLILKGLANMEFFHPTKVQEKVIPIIIRGHDVLINSETGSGKTACYLLPIIQKIITNKNSKTPIKALVLLPTRELAFQCSEMLKQFTKYLEEITSVSICGGMAIESQIIALKTSPDIILATPGRLIDMLYNYKSINSQFLENVNILVLDEADKLLELGFKDAIMEIISMIKSNQNRQTLLFSATLNTKVIEMEKDALKNPVKVKMVRSAILTNLKQSIVRMRFKKNESAGKSDNITASAFEDNIFEKRMSYLILLLQNENKVKDQNKLRSIIFFNTKKECHKAMIVLKKHEINAAQLHSDISQPERLSALESFQKGTISYLLCTDIAARGIDVEKVRCVINFQMPLLEERYIHRIGRTARKGYQGEAITICDEKERQNLKKLAKKENFNILNVNIDNLGIKKIYKELLFFKGECDEKFEGEMIEKELKEAEKDVEKTINMKTHFNEIYNKPKKSWFMTKGQKKDLNRKIKKEIKKYQDGDVEESKNDSKKIVKNKNK